MTDHSSTPTGSVSGRRLLLTGGAGFIGSHLTERLAADNEIVILDTLRRNALVSAGLDKHPHVKLIQGDVLDPAVVRQSMEGCDAIIHLASIAGVDTVLKNPVLTMRVSLLGTMNVLEAAAAKGGVKRLIDFSTSEVFGRYAYNVTEWDATTLGAVGEARWTYAVAKLATEHLAMNYWKQYQLPACSIRPFNIYGPRQVGEGAVHHFIVRALRASRCRCTTMVRRSAPGATWTTLWMASCWRSSASRRSATPSTSATRAPPSPSIPWPRRSSGWPPARPTSSMCPGNRPM